MLGTMFMSGCAFAVEEITDKDIMEAPLADENPTTAPAAYINDIEILGANIIKPEYILK